MPKTWKYPKNVNTLVLKFSLFHLGKTQKFIANYGSQVLFQKIWLSNLSIQPQPFPGDLFPLLQLSTRNSLLCVPQALPTQHAQNHTHDFLLQSCLPSYVSFSLLLFFLLTFGPSLPISPTLPLAITNQFPVSMSLFFY